VPAVCRRMVLAPARYPGNRRFVLIPAYELILSGSRTFW